MTLLALALIGCADEDTGKGPGDTASQGDSEDSAVDTEETAVDTQDTDTGEPCTTTVLGMVPEDGATEIYYKDVMEVDFDGDGSGAVITLTDDAGNDVGVTPIWDESKLKVELAASLEAMTTYTLSVSVCEVETTTTFTTSDLGLPLLMAPEDLVGQVYMFRISDATITEPAVLDVLGDSYLTTPLLFEVVTADATTIELLGALGVAAGTTYEQVSGATTWGFPAGDFSEQPTFYAESEQIEIDYEGVPIPIEHFTLRGTFAADGLSIQKGYTTGNLDTAGMGALLGLGDDPYAICDFASSYGVSCIPCDDGDATCVAIIGEEITANYLEGVDVTAVP